MSLFKSVMMKGFAQQIQVEQLKSVPPLYSHEEGGERLSHVKIADKTS